MSMTSCLSLHAGLVAILNDLPNSTASIFRLSVAALSIRAELSNIPITNDTITRFFRLSLFRFFVLDTVVNRIYL